MANTDEPSPACGLCEKAIASETKIIVCYGCERPFHQVTICSGIPKSALPYVLGMRMWFCKNCELPCSKMFQGLSEVRKRLDNAEEIIGGLETRLKNLEDLPMSGVDIITELRLREEKKMNVVIKGIPEVLDGNPEARKKSDLKTVEDLMVALDVHCAASDIRFVYRIGKKESHSTNGKPRMIMVGLNDSRLRENVLRNAHLARKIPALKHVYVDPDLTKAQIQDDNEMRKEAAKRSESGNEIWRVKGIRGAGRLARLRN